MRLVGVFAFVVAATGIAVAAQPPVVDVFSSGSPSDPCSLAYADAVSTRLQTLIMDVGQTPRTPPPDADPLDPSDNSQFAIIAKVQPPGTPGASPCPSVIPTGYALRMTLIDRSSNHYGTPVPVAISGRDVSRPIMLSEFNMVIGTPTPIPLGSPRSRVQIVILQEAATTDSDTQTANTAFSAPAFLESRLTRDLAVFQYNAMTASDYFKSLSDSHQQIPVTTDGQKTTLCAIDDKLMVLRYDLTSSESTNVWTGLQKGNAVASVDLQSCSAALQNGDTEKKFSYNLNRRYFTTKSSIFPQAVLLANFLVGSGRRDFLIPSFLGSGRLVAASFLSDPDSTAAVAAAVGEISRYVSCRTYVELRAVEFARTGATVMNDDRDRAPCPVANVVSDYFGRVNAIKIHAKPPSSNPLPFGGREATRQNLGYPATRPYVSPAPSPTPA